MSYALNTKLIHVKRKMFSSHFQLLRKQRQWDFLMWHNFFLPSNGSTTKTCWNFTITKITLQKMFRRVWSVERVKGKVFDSWILRILLVINIVEWEFTASRYNFSPPKIKGRKRKVFSCRYTKLHVCFSWNFIICNVHKRNKEKNVFKVFIHNLEAFVHTTAWGEVAEEEDLLNSMLNIYAGKLLACDLW